MRQDLRRGILLGIVAAIVLAVSSIAEAASAAIDRRLFSELQRFSTDRVVVEKDGVPCLRIFLPKGQSISYFCRFVKYFDNNFEFFRQRIALMNRLEPMAIIDGTDSLSTEVKFIYVPLNFNVPPKILPEHLETVASLQKYILIDLGQQCLGLYEYGDLVHLFPISSGRYGTPARRFVISSKEKDHYSTKYENAWMPYSLRLFGNYFLHGGILPSYAASHGCIRLIYENSIVVFNWATVGTPGEIINQAPSKRKGMVSQDEDDDEEDDYGNDSDVKSLY